MNYIQLGDTKIDISDETAENLRKQFTEPDFKNGDLFEFGYGKRLIIIPQSEFDIAKICESLRSTGITCITDGGSYSIDKPMTQKYIAENYERIRNVFDD